MASRTFFPVSTTTLRVEMSSPETYTQLDKHFMLVRYEIPNQFIWLTDKTKYPRLHIAFKTQLNLPYLSYQNDRLDGSTQMVVYALYRREPTNKVAEIDLRDTFRFVQALLDKREISFADLELHMTLKLLLTDYFHGGWEKGFVGQSNKYIYVSSYKGRHKCLEVQLHGHRDNAKQTEAQWFLVTGHARQFKTLPPPPDDNFFTEKWRQYNPVYTPIVHNQQTTLAQLLPDDTATPRDRILIPDVSSKHPARLDYHDDRNLDRGRGKLLYDFHQGFTQYLNQYGINARSQTRTFYTFPSKSKKQQLPIKDMGPIAVLDSCFNVESVDENRAQFWELLPQMYPQEQTFSIMREDLEQLDHKLPILILQNYGEQDFLEGGIYDGEEDPKATLYREYPEFPKQSLDIRAQSKQHQVNDDEEEEEENDALQQASLRRRLEVSLKELYLKHVLLNQLPVAGRLPYYEEQQVKQVTFLEFPEAIPLEIYAFLRKKTYKNISREVLLVHEPQCGCLVAYDVGSNSEIRNAVLQNLGFDWVDIRRELLKRKFRWDEEKQDAKKGKDLVRYDLILLPGLVVEIEDIRESVFYNYEAIAQARSKNRQEFPPRRFLLPTDDTTFSPEQHQAYNAFLLKEVQYMTISYQNLKKIYGDTIVQLLDLRNKHGQPHFNNLAKVYQRMGLLTKAQATDLRLTSHGIWFDDEGRYVVGNPDPIQGKQAAAHKVRQLVPLTGTRTLDMALIMRLIDVRFVRHKRFTVYPYQFKLIDLYAELTRWAL